MSFRAATSNILRQAKNAVALEPRNYIQIRGLPKTALPQDVWRMIRQANVENVIDVKLEYRRFRPTGRALLRLSDSRFTDSILPILRRCTFAASSLHANSHPDPPEFDARIRGRKGRGEAEKRGFFVGNGPAAGVLVKGCDVLISGLPQGASADVIEKYLKKQQLVGETEAGVADCEVLQVSSFANEMSQKQCLVRVKTASEAHAIARRLHMTYINPFSSSDLKPSLIQARVLY